MVIGVVLSRLNSYNKHRAILKNMHLSYQVSCILFGNYSAHLKSVYLCWFWVLRPTQNIDSRKTENIINEYIISDKIIYSLINVFLKN